MLLVNYKNGSFSTTGASEHYILAIYLANTKHLCKNDIL